MRDGDGNRLHDFEIDLKANAEIVIDWEEHAGKTMEFSGDVVALAFKQLTSITMVASATGHAERPGNHADLTLTAGSATWRAEDNGFENYTLQITKSALVAPGAAIEIGIAVTNSSARETSHSLVVTATRYMSRTRIL